MADLITLPELRSALGVDPTYDLNDDQYVSLIGYASSVIRNYTERDFGADLVTEERTFEYDGSGYLDIDDAESIASVVLTYPNTADQPIDADSWAAKPERRDDSPTYQYLLMPAYAGAIAGSPEMGFLRNADVYARERGPYASPSRVKVTGTWGWPIVPGDVKMAAIWTVQEWMSRPSGDALSAEAIEGYSRSWGGRGGEMAALAVPGRARDILSAYAKVNI